MIVGEDIAGLDRSYAGLVRFLRSCGDPTAREFATSRFLTMFPPEPFLGRSFFLEDLGPRLLCDVRAATECARDPEVVSVICEGLRHLGPEGLLLANDWWAAGGKSDTSIVPPRGDAPGREEPEKGVAALVPIPVCLEPPPPAPGVPALRLGKLVTIEIRPRAADTGQPDLRWPWHPEVADDPRLRPLHAVAQDALAAARAVVSGAGRPGFDLDFTGFDVPIAGDSIGLGMAAAMAGILSATVSGRRARRAPAAPAPGSAQPHLTRRPSGMRPRSDLAWTGTILPDGRVGPVDASTLRAKIRAAFYGGLAGIVVPWEQVQMACQEVPSSEADGVTLPADPARGVASMGLRTFDVRGVASLRMALETPGLFEPWTIPITSLRTSWHRRRVTLRWVAAVVVVAALASTGISVLSEAGNRRGPHASMSQDRKLVRVTFDGGARPLDIHPPWLAAYAEIGRRLPGDRSGKERLVMLTTSSDSTPATLSIHELRGGRELWKYAFTSSGLPIDLRRGLPEGVFNGKTGVIGDLDGDGDNEIVVALSVHPGSSCVLRLFDSERKPVGALFHPGHVEGLSVSDLDGDGKGEVIATGFHASSYGVSAVFLRRSDFRGEADSTQPWDLQHQPCMAHFVFPRPPHLVEALGGLQLGTEPSLRIIPRPDGPPLVCVYAFIPNPYGEPLRPGYFVYLSGLPPSVTSVVADAVLDQATQTWMREGRCRTDFASRDFIERWRRSFRVFDHIDLDTGPAGDPL